VTLRSIFTRTATITLAAAALAAPTAIARPADTPPTATAAVQEQDLRAVDARDAAAKPRDAREAAARPLPGPPTWPTNPQPINSVPAAEATDSGNGIGWATIAIGIAGSLLAVGAIAGIAGRTRRAARARITA
jgi:hypothetical protein